MINTFQSRTMIYAVSFRYADLTRHTQAWNDNGERCLVLPLLVARSHVGLKAPILRRPVAHPIAEFGSEFVRWSHHRFLNISQMAMSNLFAAKKPAR